MGLGPAWPRQGHGGAAGPRAPFCRLRVRGRPQDLDKLVQWLHQAAGAPAGVKGGHEGVRRAGLHTLSLCGDPQVEGMQHHAERPVLPVRGLPIGQVPHNGVTKGAAVYTELVCTACVGNGGQSGGGAPP